MHPSLRDGVRAALWLTILSIGEFFHVESTLHKLHPLLGNFGNSKVAQLIRTFAPLSVFKLQKKCSLKIWTTSTISVTVSLIPPSTRTHSHSPIIQLPRGWFLVGSRSSCLFTFSNGMYTLRGQETLPFRVIASRQKIETDQVSRFSRTMWSSELTLKCPKFDHLWSFS